MNRPANSSRHLNRSHGRRLLRLFLMMTLVFSSSLGMVKVGTAQYQEVTCPNPNPTNTAVWKNFREFVRQEYGRELPGEAMAVASGHALGRVALAQHDILERQQAVACLQRGLDQLYTQAEIHYAATNGPKGAYQVRHLHRLMQESARGEHDDLVKRYTGVTSTSPAYAVLGATAPPPQPSWQPPVTPNPNYPIYPPSQPQSPRVQPEIGYCETGVYSGFSVAKARRLIAEADRIRLPRECYSSEDYLVCRKVSSLLHSAIDNLTQVLQVSRSPVGQGCKYCPIERHKYSNLGYTIDRISKDLYQRGYRTPPSSGMGWHYLTLEREPLCQRPPSPGSLSIGPVSRDDCPKHCDDAAPACNYAYYVARTQTCSWRDDQSTPNLHALETSDIWDRARRRWLTRANGNGGGHRVGMSGFFVAKVEGKGWRKAWGGASWKIDGYKKFVINFDDTVSQPKWTQWYLALPVGYDVQSYFRTLQNDARKHSAGACAKLPPTCPCAPDPDIWVGDPEYTIVAGPFKTFEEAHAASGNMSIPNGKAGSNKHWRLDGNHRINEVERDCRNMGYSR